MSGRTRSPRRRERGAGCLVSSVVSSVVSFLVVLLTSGAAPIAAGDWPTYQGSARRAGNVDGRAGPKRPRVLWALPGRSHYLAAPAPVGERLFVSALGAFNAPEISALDLASGAAERVVWTRRPPVLELPTASPVTARDGVVYAGEGMHQNIAGAVVAFAASDGLPLWRQAFAGELRHVEGGPTIDAAGRVFVGCGSGGIVCIDGDRVASGGKVRSRAEHEVLARAVWEELVAAYEKEKRDDPDFAVPPNPGDLASRLDARPAIRWTAGNDAWHVDSSVLLVDAKTAAGIDSDRVIAGSAFLEDERSGERAAVCVDAARGRLLWKAPLGFNPWGAPSVATIGEGERARTLAFIGCASIRFDPATVDGARGEVVALDAASGERVWSLEVPGAVLGPLAIDASGRRGVFAATDGRVVCVDTASGEEVWRARSSAPFFAGVAIAGDRVYGCDLDGRVLALSLERGERLWELDLGRDPQVGFPGRVFASLVCESGTLFAMTHNLDGPHASEPTVVVAIGEAEAATAPVVDAGIVVDVARRRVLVDVEIAPRKLPHLEKIYPLEVIATARQGKKAHETVLVCDARPSAVHAALESLGLHAGAPAVAQGAAPSGPRVRLFLEYVGRGGVEKRIDVARTIVDRQSGLGLRARDVGWIFTGSTRIESAAGGETIYGADFSGTLATLFPVTAETVFQSTLDMEAESLLSLEIAPGVPPVGTRARLVIEPVEERVEEGRR